MENIGAVAAVICACTVAVSLISAIAPQGNMRKVVNLVIGAFMLCCMIAPVKNALSGFELNVSSAPISDDFKASADEAYNEAVLTETRNNLETSLKAYLTQHDIKAEDVAVILNVNDKGGIYIDSVSIYISIKDSEKSYGIKSLVKEKFEVIPDIITR